MDPQPGSITHRLTRSRPSSDPDRVQVGLRRWSAAIAFATAVLTTSPADAAPSDAEEELEEQAFIDPRKRPLPRTHRFRLGVELDYIRLSAAVDEGTGEVQRFHYVPLSLDFAYHAQVLKYLSIRPSFGIGGNVANSMEAMPLLLHPQLHAGFQGRWFGAAVGYGALLIPIQNPDATSASRGGLGQPVIRNNHHVGLELSVTTRVHRRREQAPGAGQLSLIVRLAGVKSTTYHFDLVARRWRFMLMFNAGWYFGDGKRARARRQERRRRRQQAD